MSEFSSSKNQDTVLSRYQYSSSFARVSSRKRPRLRFLRLLALVACRLSLALARLRELQLPKIVIIIFRPMITRTVQKFTKYICISRNLRASTLRQTMYSIFRLFTSELVLVVPYKYNYKYTPTCCLLSLLLACL